MLRIVFTDKIFDFILYYTKLGSQPAVAQSFKQSLNTQLAHALPEDAGSAEVCRGGRGHKQHWKLNSDDPPPTPQV